MGNLYPWGIDAKPGAANLGDDYVPSGKGGQEDGYNLWAPVDQLKGDVSPFGIMGMAGNVQEWTSTWAPHPDLVIQVPVLCGGHFGLKSSPEILTSRHFADTPEEATLARGFRTASDNPPDGSPLSEEKKQKRAKAK
ncbi:MAG: serine/threonine protein kinase [Verrucomicrobiaceae bacterium]|nr:serine/threonine protein kinase [Verrucomicrobiaceae bacterium]